MYSARRSCIERSGERKMLSLLQSVAECFSADQFVRRAFVRSPRVELCSTRAIRMGAALRTSFVRRSDRRLPRRLGRCVSKGPCSFCQLLICAPTACAITQTRLASISSKTRAESHPRSDDDLIASIKRKFAAEAGCAAVSTVARIGAPPGKNSTL